MEPHFRNLTRISCPIFSSICFRFQYKIKNQCIRSKSPRPRGLLWLYLHAVFAASAAAALEQLRKKLQGVRIKPEGWRHSTAAENYGAKVFCRLFSFAPAASSATRCRRISIKVSVFWTRDGAKDRTVFMGSVGQIWRFVAKFNGPAVKIWNWNRQEQGNGWANPKKCTSKIAHTHTYWSFIGVEMI